MRKAIFISLFAGFMLLGTAPVPGFAYWIWTPKTGKWTNPKYSVKPTPKEQLRAAVEFYDSKKYQEAARECLRLIKYYPKINII